MAMVGLLLPMKMRANGVEINGIHYLLNSGSLTAQVTYTGETFIDPCTYTGRVVIPRQVTSNGLSYRVTSIGFHAFGGTTITSVTLPASITSLADYAFGGCSLLDTIYCKGATPPSAYSDAFRNVNPNVIVVVPSIALDTYRRANIWKNLSHYVGDSSHCGSELTWRMSAEHDTLWIEGEGAMYDYPYTSAVPWNRYRWQITHVSLSDSITHIGAYALYDVTSLQTLRLPSSLRSIGFSGCLNCTGMTELIWNDSIETLGDQAFGGSGIHRWTVPATVRSLGRSAITSSPLEYVELQSLTPPTMHPLAFGTQSQRVHVPCQALGAYRDAMSLDFVGSDSPEIRLLSSDSERGEVSFWQYDCDSALLTATNYDNSVFTGWSDGATENPRVITLEHDSTITAIFSAERRYLIRFFNSDHTLLEADSVLYGEMPAYGGETPVMPGLQPGDSVVFRGWYPQLDTVTGDFDYTARFAYIGTSYDGLCLHAEQESTIGMSHHYWNERTPQLQYSEDGRIWYDWDFTTLALAAGDSLFFRGENSQGIGQYIYWLEEMGYSTFTMSGRIRATGNIISLIDTTMTTHTLPPYAFAQLFKDCRALVEAPEMPVDTVGNHACQLMFNCTGISRTPDLPSMNIGKESYRNMFSGCSNLTEVCELPATEMAEGCYMRMFESCAQLHDVQRVLPATVLPKNCYWEMYAFCPLIEVAPEIMAETLAPQCLVQMFWACSNLREINVHFTDWQRNDRLVINPNDFWVRSVAETGTFYCHSSLPQQFDENHIPVGWTVVFTDTYMLTLTVNDSTMGCATGGGSYVYGTEVQCEALPNEGYMFTAWSDGSTENPRTVNLTEDTTLEAIFVEIPDALENTDTRSARKMLRDGRIIIRNDAQTYDILGSRIQ